jgi:hypothetical protein
MMKLNEHLARDLAYKRHELNISSAHQSDTKIVRQGLEEISTRRERRRKYEIAKT